MKRYKQFTSFIISDFTTKVWYHPRHNHNHYEVIFIKNGIGTHKINKLEVSYKSGDIFLLGPDDSHEFEVIEETRFIYLKFTLEFFESDRDYLSKSSLQEIKELLNDREIRNSKISTSKEDQELFSKQFDVISVLEESGNPYEPIVFFQLISILEMLKKYTSIQNDNLKNKDLQKGMEPVLHFIHKNIYYPKKLRLANLATEFNTTKNYFGKFFKRNMKMSLRDYMMQYKLQLIENRLSSGSYTKKEIATEFGFTDESHLLKTLKKQDKNATLLKS